MASVVSRRFAATTRALISSSARIAPQSSFRPSLLVNIPQNQAHGRLSTKGLRLLHTATPLKNVSASAAEADGSVRNEKEPITQFAELGESRLVDRTIVHNLVNRMSLKTMTDIQSQTIDRCLRGDNVLGQAKTGTGKTLGFLIPTVQRILEKKPELVSFRRRSPIDVKALIISPTRELAEQIAVEARRLVSGTGIKIQTGVGGTQKSMHLRQMQDEGCDILVGTPGRLLDLLSDPRSGVVVENLEALVLDEADRLLDDGFAPELESIHGRLPDTKTRDRQTLMFSATMPREVIHMVRQFMGRDYAFVKTVQEDEVPTHERVPQAVVRLSGMENTFPALIELVKKGQEAAEKEGGMPFKAIVFFNANNEASLYYQMFKNLGEAGTSRISSHPFGGLTTVEMHSKLSQAQRTRNSDLFRRAREAIMFSSDVTARGMDFPNVSHIIQIGIARDRESYIHRLGRTGRAGKQGQGWIFVSGIDESEARYKLQGLPIKKDKTLETPNVDMTVDGEITVAASESITQAIAAAQRTTFTAKSEAYKSMFGTYQWVPYKEDLVEALNNLSRFGWGLERPPAVSPGLANKLGIGRMRSLNTNVAADAEILDREAREMEERKFLSERRDRFGAGGRGGSRGGRFGGRDSFGSSRGRYNDRGSSGRLAPYQRDRRPNRQVSWD